MAFLLCQRDFLGERQRQAVRVVCDAGAVAQHIPLVRAVHLHAVHPDGVGFGLGDGDLLLHHAALVDHGPAILRVWRWRGPVGVRHDKAVVERDRSSLAPDRVVAVTSTFGGDAGGGSADRQIAVGPDAISAGMRIDDTAADRQVAVRLYARKLCGD